MSTTSSEVRRTSYANAASRTDTASASAIAEQFIGPPDVQMYLQRVREIGAIIDSAMSKLSEIDWKRESPAISEAENHLNEIMAQYADGSVSKADVKAVYKQWVNALRGGLF